MTSFVPAISFQDISYPQKHAPILDIAKWRDMGWIKVDLQIDNDCIITQGGLTKR